MDPAIVIALKYHEACTWEQVGPCVYCVEHRNRLYQGQLPESRRTCNARLSAADTNKR